MPTLIYHLTHQNNLPDILESGCLHCVNDLGNQASVNIAHPAIQTRRAITPVSAGPGGALHDYVPFYFANRQPMLYALHRGNVEEYDEGQQP